MVGGIGAGKTKFVAILATMLGYESPGVPGMVVAPTYPMARDVDAVALEGFWLEQGIPFTARRAEHTYVLSEPGTTIMLRSCDNPDRLRGPNLGWVLGDEIAMWDDSEEQPQRSAVNISLGRIRHPAAKRHLFAVVGTPNGFDHLHARFAEPQGKRLLPDAWFTRAPTWENTYLDPAYVAGLKRAYDPLLYRQEVGGEFVAVGESLTYYAFSDANLKAFPVDPHLPLVLGCDFNVRGAWVVSQSSSDGVARAVDEIAFSGQNSTGKACDEFLARYAAHKAGLKVYADQSGKGRHSSATWTDFEIIKDKLGVYPYSPGRNPPIQDRVAAVNAKLCSASGEIGLYVHPEKCPLLIRDFRRLTNIPGTREPDKDRDAALSHASDGLGYYIYAAHPFISGRPKRAA